MSLLRPSRNKFIIIYSMNSNNVMGGIRPPVNINISFNINQRADFQGNDVIGRKIVKQRLCIASHNPHVPQIVPITPKPSYELQMNQCNTQTMKKPKRNSINESYLIKTSDKKDKSHCRKQSLQQKRQDQITATKHKKVKSNLIRSVRKSGNTQRNLITKDKNIRQGMIKKEEKVNHSKRDRLSIQKLPVVQSRGVQSSKKITNPPKTKHQAKVKSFRHRNIDEEVQYLSSINNSLFVNEPNDTSQEMNNNQIIINTENSLTCIDEIHDIEVNQQNNQKIQSQNNNSSPTIQLIENYIQLSKYGELNPQMISSNNLIIDYQQIIQNKQQDHEEGTPGIDAALSYSSQMTKQQRQIYKEQKQKITQLRKRQIEKWSQVLQYTKQSIKGGDKSAQQIIQNIYNYLQQAKKQICSEIHCSNNVSFEVFTKKLHSNSVKQPSAQVDRSQKSSFNGHEGSLESGYDQQFKFITLDVIDKTLKSRCVELEQRFSKDLRTLEQRKQKGKMTYQQFIKETNNLEIWTNRQKLAVSQALKNLWKGYFKSKTIIGSQKSDIRSHRPIIQSFSQKHLSSFNKKQNTNCQLLSYSRVRETITRQQLQTIDPYNTIEPEEHDQYEQIQKQFKNIRFNQFSSDQSQKILDQESQSISAESLNFIRNQILKRDHQDSQIQQFHRNQDRLANISQQDREDIIEFIFLDLSIELYQEPCTDNQIMDMINRHVASLKRQACKKKGISTNLDAVKQFLKRLVGFILNNHNHFLHTLDRPLSPFAPYLLRQMHQNKIQDLFVIPISVFDDFEGDFLDSLQFEVYFENDEQREDDRVQELKRVAVIHHKALFYALNQYLSTLRLFSLERQQFPCKKQISLCKTKTDLQKQKKLKQAAQKVVQYCSYVCGLLVDKQQSLVGNAIISPYYLQDIREDRLQKMLTNQLIENDHIFNFYEGKYVQILVQLSNSMKAALFSQAASEISAIVKLRRL